LTALGVNLAILFNKRVRYVKKVKNHWSSSMVLNLGFTLPQEASTNYQGDVNRYALYNMESLVNKFTRKCICFFNLFNTRGIETKDNYL